jgi:hypothetical protein
VCKSLSLQSHTRSLHVELDCASSHSSSYCITCGQQSICNNARVQSDERHQQTNKQTDRQTDRQTTTRCGRLRVLAMKRKEGAVKSEKEAKRDRARAIEQWRACRYYRGVVVLFCVALCGSLACSFLFLALFLFSHIGNPSTVIRIARRRVIDPHALPPPCSISRTIFARPRMRRGERST